MLQKKLSTCCIHVLDKTICTEEIVHLLWVRGTDFSRDSFYRFCVRVRTSFIFVQQAPHSLMSRWLVKAFVEMSVVTLASC